MERRSEPYVVAAGHSRRDDAFFPFKATAVDTGGLLSAWEFTLGPWDSGPVLHLHTSADEALYITSGVLLAQLGETRITAETGGFVWMPRGVPHTFANAGPDPVHLLVLAMPGGLEYLFAEQAAYLAALTGPPDPIAMDRIASRHRVPTLGPAIRADGAPLSM
jgi:mannose-6-phosphate isomerase-like protein (cupin superfamily)